VHVHKPLAESNDIGVFIFATCVVQLDVNVGRQLSIPPLHLLCVQRNIYVTFLKLQFSGQHTRMELGVDFEAMLTFTTVFQMTVHVFEESCGCTLVK
jgi:hypothetical protein